MVVASFLVKSSIVNANSPNVGHSSQNQLIDLVPHNNDAYNDPLHCYDITSLNHINFNF